MPEGPSLVILRELTQAFQGQRVLAAAGNAKIDKARLLNQRIVALRTWGKHFLIEFQGFALRIHFLMFGSWNGRKHSCCASTGWRTTSASVPGATSRSRRHISAPEIGAASTASAASASMCAASCKPA